MNVHVLPPDVVPMRKHDKQQAVEAITEMIAHWWREHGYDDEPPDEAATSSAIMQETGDGLP